MLTCIAVNFIFDSLRLGLSSGANILQIADVALRVVFLLFFAMFLAVISPFSCRFSHSWNEWSVCHFFFTTETTQLGPQVFSVTAP